MTSEELARRSRKAALISGLGGAGVLAAIAVGSYQIARLQRGIAEQRAQLQHIDATKAQRLAEVKDLEAQKQNLGEEISSLATQLKVARSQIKLQASAISQVTRGVAVAKLPITAVATPKAEAKEVSPPSAKQAIYDFSLWIQVPVERKTEIRKVDYEFNHPSFTQKQISSADASNGYRVGYHGWGCLERVIVKFQLRDGTVVPMDFDMCAALGWSS